MTAARGGIAPRAAASNGGAAAAAGPPRFTRRAVAALFIERQHLARPRGRKLTARNLERFAGDVGGIQLDSINVLERAHYLTAWSRFGEFPRARLDRLAWRQRVLFEYWAHAACLVPRADLAQWRRAMLDYTLRHTGWSIWLRKHAATIAAVEAAIRERGPLGNADFREAKPGGRGGWWSWKPATHAFHYLWMTGRLLVDSRVHFHKRYDLAERVLPEIATVTPPDADRFNRWHLRRSLHAMGAATETDLLRYLTFPGRNTAARRRTLAEAVARGEVVEVAVTGVRGRWFALAEDLPALAAAGRRRRAARGTTLLAPFDSLLWHRERVKRLFGFDYRIEVYTPGHKRVHGYYTLPIFHDGHLIGRVDAKTHREARRLEVRHVHFEPWFATGAPPPAAGWGTPDRAAALAGLAGALRSLAAFAGADQVALVRTTPARWRRDLLRALR